MTHQWRLAFAALTVGARLAQAPAADADTDYKPPDWINWNGHHIYISPADHSGQNRGCLKSNEDTMADNSARVAAEGEGGLIYRGYKVKVGDQGYRENVRSSNLWGAHAHLPLHSNAGAWNCNPGGNPSSYGTWGIYQSSEGRRLADRIAHRVGWASPGTNDKACHTQECTNYGTLLRAERDQCRRGVHRS